MSAAAIRPAISAAMVEGEKPRCSSHRSEPNDGPWATRKSAAGLMWSRSSDAVVRPSWSAIRIGYAVSSSWVPNESGAVLPFTRLLRGIEPSGSCWRSNRNSTASRAVASVAASHEPVHAS